MTTRRILAALGLALFFLGLTLGRVTAHTPLPGVPVFREVHVPAAPSKEPGSSPSMPGLILEPAPSRSLTPRPVIEQPAELVTPRPVVVAPPKGYAGWHRDPNVSWFGPGFYGNRTACGQTLTETLQGVAHKSLPCGTLVTFRHAGIVVTVPVVDRGPYVAGRTWDLTGATCLALGHCYTGPLDWRLR